MAKKKGQKERLKPLSFYGLDPRDVIRAFMQIDPKELKRLKEEEESKWQKPEETPEAMRELKGL